MRIVKWQYKLVYAVAGYVLIGALLWLLPVENFLALVVGSTLDLAQILLGARIFRGENEDLRAPRAWWRMTSKPKLSRRLGRVFIIFTGLLLLILALTLLGVKTSRGRTLSSLTDAIEGVIFFAILAFLYTNSAVRMKRLGITSDPKPPAPLSSDLSKPKFRATS